MTAHSVQQSKSLPDEADCSDLALSLLALRNITHALTGMDEG